MKIVLAEIRDDQKVASREFDKTDLKIGRDKQRCDLIFEQAQWPMVSRLHALLHIEGGRCYLTDNDSTHGTLINGQRISGRTEIQIGSRFQLGAYGPVLSLEFIGAPPSPPKFSETLVDVAAAEQQAALREKVAHAPVPPQRAISKTLVDDVHVPTSPPSSEPPTHSPEGSAARTFPKSPALLLCESGSPSQLGREFTLRNDATLLGRDNSADIEIDAAAAVVSRRHAEIRRQPDGSYLLLDLKSFNGTLLNQQLISQPEVLHHGDRVQLGGGGPILRFINPANPVPRTDATPSMAISGSNFVNRVSNPSLGRGLERTIVYRAGTDQLAPVRPETSTEVFLFEHSFNGKEKLSVGRGADNDIRLDGLLISKHHARFFKTSQGVMVEEAGSTNGVYLNGGRVSGRRLIQKEDIVQIGPFLLRADVETGIAVFDTRAKTRIDAVEISEIVPRGQGSRKLLDQVSLAIDANEFVGVLGPSGAGKSTLIQALNGMRRTRGGRVLINNLELYQHIDSLKQSIGYVPQDDIIHRELTVYRTLYYVARLRLSWDVSKNEIDQIIGEVLDVTGLTTRRDTLVSQLSGGQRKRVSIAVELITKPSIIFLDEPTSGLDPGAEERIMKLFRQIAESGRTVILTTHAMENVRLFDKVVLLMGGKLIFYGKPSELLKFVGVNNFIDLYNKIEEPIEIEAAKLSSISANVTRAQQRTYETRRAEIAEVVAEDWRQRFIATESYKQYVSTPLSQVQQATTSAAAPRRRRSVIDSALQWITLVRRYFEVLAHDKWNLFVLLGQAPIIALLTYLVVGKNDPRDFPYFILALVAIWFGSSVAARELVKERPIFRRERMVNLRLLPYVASKLWVLSFIVVLQAALLFLTLKILHFAGIMYLPGLLFGVPQLLVLCLTGIVGIALGLLISAVVRTSEVATSLIPLILIPQILFAGLVAVPTGFSRLVGAAMPATWSFDELKRLSTLDTLKEEGSDPGGPNEGRGLQNHIKDLNNENIEKARRQLEDYRNQTSRKVEDYTRQIESQLKPGSNANVATRQTTTAPKIDAPPPVPTAIELSEDLSRYVAFMHPWGGHILNITILIVMLFTLVIATVVALRTHDTR